MSEPNDPFNTVLDAIWQAFEDWQPLSGYLADLTIEPAGGVTRLLFSGTSQPARNYVMQTANGMTKLSASGSNFQPVQNYALKIETDDVSPEEFLAVKWAVICALANINRDTHPFGLKSVQDIEVIDDAAVMAVDGEGVEIGWTGQLTIQVTFNFNRDQLIAPN